MDLSIHRSKNFKKGTDHIDHKNESNITNDHKTKIPQENIKMMMDRSHNTADHINQMIEQN